LTPCHNPYLVLSPPVATSSNHFAHLSAPFSPLIYSSGPLLFSTTCLFHLSQSFRALCPAVSRTLLTIVLPFLSRSDWCCINLTFLTHLTFKSQRVVFVSPFYS
jgi:hypothetical protein